MKNKFKILSFLGILYMVFLISICIKKDNEFKNKFKKCNVYEGIVEKIEIGQSSKFKNCVKITYSWEVNGIKFESNRALPGETYNEWLSQRRWDEIGRPNLGQKIKVFSYENISFLYPSLHWVN